MACSGGSHPHLKYRFPGSSVFSTAGIPADIGRQYDISTFFIGAVPGSSGIHRLKVQKSLYPTGCGLLSAGTVRTSPSPGTRDNLLSYRHPSRAFLPDSLLDFQRGPAGCLLASPGQSFWYRQPFSLRRCSPFSFFLLERRTGKLSFHFSLSFFWPTCSGKFFPGWDLAHFDINPSGFDENNLGGRYMHSEKYIKQMQIV